jgi:hypothetical protein
LIVRLKELTRLDLPDGTIGIIAIPIVERRRRFMRGWTRVDDRAGGKLHAIWKRDDGALQLVHCGHPTALRPWAIFARDGTSVTPLTFSTLKRAIDWISANTSKGA